MNYFNLQAYLWHTNIRVDHLGGVFWRGMWYYCPIINVYFTGPFVSSWFSVRNKLSAKPNKYPLLLLYLTGDASFNYYYYLAGRSPGN